MAPHHVLLLGGHGQISQFLTPLLLRRSWTVTSVIRAKEQVPAIEKLGTGQPGTLNVLVQSIEDVASQEQAADILNKVKPDMIAWSAGMVTHCITTYLVANTMQELEAKADLTR